MTLTLDYRANFLGEGNSYGFSVHAERTQAALQSAGVQLQDGADTVLRVASPMDYKPVPGRFNVAYVAWESSLLPGEYAANLRRADLVVVTAPWLKPVMESALGSVPVEVAPLGVDAPAFPFRVRRIDRRHPFRLLWLGAPNTRKGYAVALEAWRLFEHRSDMQLVMKTTVSERIEQSGNLIFDSRNLPRAQLAKLYHSAHVFIYPTFGEGFGLTLFEALATGCPAIWTDCTAPADFLDTRHGWPVAGSEHGTALGPMTRPPPEDFARAIVCVREAYGNGQAQRKARRAAKLVRETLTWENTAQYTKIFTRG